MSEVFLSPFCVSKTSKNVEGSGFPVIMRWMKPFKWNKKEWKCLEIQKFSNMYKVLQKKLDILQKLFRLSDDLITFCVNGKQRWFHSSSCWCQRWVSRRGWVISWGIINVSVVVVLPLLLLCREVSVFIFLVSWWYSGVMYAMIWGTNIMLNCHKNYIIRYMSFLDYFH